MGHRNPFALLLVPRFAAFGLLALLVSHCGASPSRTPATRQPEQEANVGAVFQGKAVYYAKSFQGKKTASGEAYDMHAFTAAHRTLPFGTLVRVTSLSSRKSVVARINDRGPFGKKERIIDLSWAAAERIDLITPGVLDVEVEVIGAEE